MDVDMVYEIGLELGAENDALKAENASLKALVAEMVEELDRIRFYSDAYSEIRRIAVALIARAKGAAVS